MKWVYYPLQVISDAAATAFGGIFAIVAALFCGQASVLWVCDGELASSRLMYLPFLIVLSIGTAIFHVWGLLYCCVLAVLFYRVLYCEASRLRAFLGVSVFQACVGAIDAWRFAMSDCGAVFRAIVVLCVFLLIGGIVLINWWLQRRSGMSQTE